MTVHMSRRHFIAGASTALAAGCARPPLSEGPEAGMAATVAEALPPPPPTYAETLREIGVGFTPPARGKAILVNIPSFELVAFKDAEPVITSRVIVGERRSPTPVTTVGAGVVRFRPYWRPTPDMIRRHGYADRLHPPGRRNPLGLATIRFDDGSLIYLHGTNAPRMFKRDNRALSNGCIRVERLDELVAWTLDWPMEEVQAAMNGRRSFDAETGGFPIHLGYYTRFRMPGEEVREHRDVYRLA